MNGGQDAMKMRPAAAAEASSAAAQSKPKLSLGGGGRGKALWAKLRESEEAKNAKVREQKAIARASWAQLQTFVAKDFAGTDCWP